MTRNKLSSFIHASIPKTTLLGNHVRVMSSIGMPGR
jgi:hypothetical protein